MTRKIFLSADHLAAISDSARRAFPSECCGLIEGIGSDDGWRVTALHETRNLAADPSHNFLVDPEVQFRLLRSLRGTDRNIIGCFHSHPNGSIEPSARDLAAAEEDGFLWLIAAVRADAEPTIAAFVYDARGEAFERVSINRSG